MNRVAIIAVLLLALGAIGAGWHLNKVHQARQEGRQEVQARWNRAEAQRLKDQATEAARRAKAHQEIIDAEQIRRREAETVAARLRAGSDGLRAQLAAIARGAPAAGGGAAAGADSRVLAHVLEQCRGRVVALVAEADATRAAGASCERAYDALRPAP